MNNWKKLERLLEIKEIQGYYGLSNEEQEEYDRLLNELWEVMK